MTTYDLLNYIKGDGRTYSVHYDWHGGGNQVMQTQTDGWRWYLVKWSEWELLFADDAYIYRAADTSPGDGKVYELRDDDLSFGSRWVKRHMALNERTERNPRVIWYDKATGRKLSEAHQRSWLKLDAYYDRWNTPAGFAVDDVILLGWYLDDAMTQRAERTWYAKNYGLVGWQGSIGRSSIESVFPANEAPVLKREPLAWYSIPAAQPTPAPVPTPPAEWVWYRPVRAPYTITSSFGERPTPEPGDGDKTEKHFGTDYTSGDWIAYAAQDGTVVIAGWDDSGYGNLVKLDHGSGQTSLYGHLDSIDVAVGDAVRANQRIGVIGSKGRSTARHLHWETRKDNAPYGPAGMVRDHVPLDDAPTPVPTPTPDPPPIDPDVYAAVLAQVAKIEQVQLELAEIKESLQGVIGYA